MRIIFMGSPEFAVPFLQALLKYNIVAVFSAPLTTRSKRGNKIEHCAVAKFALEHQLPLFTPPNLKDLEIEQQITKLKPDVIIVVAYGALLPKNILTIPKYGCINMHASLLPRWRGAAPIERAIEEGDLTTGIAVMQMEAGLDTGPVALTYEMPINNLNSLELRTILANKGAELLTEALEQLKRGMLKFTPQIGAPSYAHKITKEETKLDWYKKAESLERKIRSLAPQPGAWCEMRLLPQQANKWQSNRVKILKAEVNEQATRFSKKCSDGKYLKILLCQKAGGKIVTAEQFTAAYREIEIL